MTAQIGVAAIIRPFNSTKVGRRPAIGQIAQMKMRPEMQWIAGKGDHRASCEAWQDLSCASA
jgi:hypothetical protein